MPTAGATFWCRTGDPKKKGDNTMITQEKPACLSREQQAKFFAEIASKCRTSGLHMALLFALVCGIDYESAARLEYHHVSNVCDTHVISVDTKGNSWKQCKQRLVPIPPFVSRVIDFRKMDQMNVPGVIPGVTHDKISVLGEKIIRDTNGKPLGSMEDFVALGTEILLKIGYPKEDIEKAQVFVNEIKLERDPISYIMRISLATDLHILGLRQEVRIWILGISERGLKFSNDQFVADGKIKDIGHALQWRPLYNLSLTKDGTIVLKDPLINANAWLNVADPCALPFMVIREILGKCNEKMVSAIKMSRG